MNFIHFRDHLFHWTFQKMLVFTILWEDAEVEYRLIQADEKSSIFGISGAGCALASLMSKRPRSIDAVDMNKNHLALTGLKLASTQHIQSFQDYYQLLGNGRHPHSEKLLGQLTVSLPPWMRHYWKQRKSIFNSGLHSHGLLNRIFSIVRKICHIDEEWLREMIQKEGVRDRIEAADKLIEIISSNRLTRAISCSPIQLLAQGVNFRQRDLNFQAYQTDNWLTVIHKYMRSMASTDVERNWFLCYFATGHFNGSQPEAVPPYLRRSAHECSLNGPTRLTFHHSNLLDVLKRARQQGQRWTHFILCDVLDWMPEDIQRIVLDNVLQTAEDGAFFLHRTVGLERMMEKHDINSNFKLLEQESKQATAMDRSCLYKHVDIYRITR